MRLYITIEVFRKQNHTHTEQYIPLTDHRITITRAKQKHAVASKPKNIIIIRVFCYAVPASGYFLV